jgi:hypothetical protein
MVVKSWIVVCEYVLTDAFLFSMRLKQGCLTIMLGVLRGF